MNEPVASNDNLGPSDDLVGTAMDTNGDIIMEPVPAPAPESAINFEKVVGVYPQGNQTGAVLLVPIDSGLVPVRIIAPEESIQTGKKYFSITTDAQLNIRRIGVEIPQHEYFAIQAQRTQQTQQQQRQQMLQQQGQASQQAAAAAAATAAAEGQTQAVAASQQAQEIVEGTAAGTTGDELADLLSGVWQGLTESEMQPDAFIWMIVTLCLGLVVGSIYRIGWCRIPGLNASYCNNATMLLALGGMLGLALMSKAREPEDPSKDLFDYWQTWVIAISGGLILIVIMMFAFRRSGVTALGDFGGQSGMFGAPGLSPAMSGYI